MIALCVCKSRPALMHSLQVYIKLTQSICPSVWGHDSIKQAVLLMLLGGVHKKTAEVGGPRSMPEGLQAHPSQSSERWWNSGLAGEAGCMYTAAHGHHLCPLCCVHTFLSVSL